MKTIPQSMLDSGTLCFCWKIILSDGTTYGFTDHDADLTFDDLTFEARSGFTASAIESGLGLKIDNLEAEGALSSQNLNEDDIKAGKFDGAEIFIYRVNWQNASQFVLLRRGNIGDITRTAWGFRVELRGLAHRLSYPHGRVFQKNCDADLGDSRCKVNLSGHRHRVLISSIGSENHLIKVRSDTLLKFAESHFDYGKVKFITGKNEGLEFSIRSHTKQNNEVLFFLWQSPPNALRAGNQLDVITGCDKQFVTCQQKFSNQINFQGFPHLPGNDYIQYYPRD